MKNRKLATLILSAMMVMCTMPSFVFAQETAPAEAQEAPAVSGGMADGPPPPPPSLPTKPCPSGCPWPSRSLRTSF